MVIISTAWYIFETLSCMAMFWMIFYLLYLGIKVLKSELEEDR